MLLLSIDAKPVQCLPTVIRAFLFNHNIKPGNEDIIQLYSLQKMFPCRHLHVARWATPKACIYIGCLVALHLACSVGKASLQLQLLDKQVISDQTLSMRRYVVPSMLSSSVQ